MKKNYLHWVFPLTNNGLMSTDNLSTTFKYIICLPSIQPILNENLDMKRVEILTVYLDSFINWKEEEKLWEYLGNMYLIMNPSDSIINFTVNYYLSGWNFFKQSNEKWKQIYKIKKWYSFMELQKIKYPKWSDEWNNGGYYGSLIHQTIK